MHVEYCMHFVHLCETLIDATLILQARFDNQSIASKSYRSNPLQMFSICILSCSNSAFLLFARLIMGGQWYQPYQYFVIECDNKVALRSSTHALKHARTRDATIALHQIELNADYHAELQAIIGRRYRGIMCNGREFTWLSQRDVTCRVSRGPGRYSEHRNLI